MDGWGPWQIGSMDANVPLEAMTYQAKRELLPLFVPAEGMGFRTFAMWVHIMMLACVGMR